MGADPSGLSPFGRDEPIPDWAWRIWEYRRHHAPLDAKSEHLLSTLEAPVAWSARQFLDDVKRAGIDIRIVQGIRTYAEQNSLYAQGRTMPGQKVTNARGGQSNHNFRVAFDVGIFVKGQNGNSVYLNESRMYGTVASIAKKYGLEWGGDWHTITDEPHYQYPISDKAAKAS